MKAPARLLQNLPRSRHVAGLLAAAGACALLSGCVGNPFDDARVDPKSPIAAEAQAAANTRRPFPRFTDIPPVPKDVRPRAQYGDEAAQVEATRDALFAATAPDTWTLNHSDSFADTARQAAGPEAAPNDPAATAAFAADLRKRATPPPPPKR